MKAWPRPPLPTLPQDPAAGPIRIFDTARRTVVPLQLGPAVGMYVCGITPYDATHLGHAATYVTFDVLGRVIQDAGHDLTYVQNVTDVDDPLLERAERDGINWRDLAAREIQLFRDDMTALRVVPPHEYIGVVEAMSAIENAVLELVDAGAAYRVDEDIYLDLSQRPDFGSVSGWDRAHMLAVFAERGGDPQRPGKRDPLDPLLWRAHRPGEPRWDSERLGAGRPGWHIECTAIARDRLGIPFAVQGGGDDLIFPHHEMSAVQATALCRCPVFAQAYVHQAMVGLDGEKMSKSKGNLVLVSRLLGRGEDPMAIRLALLAHHYRTAWQWQDDLLQEARDRLQRWRAAGARDAGDGGPVLRALRERLRDDLDTPGALAVLDQWATEALTSDARSGEHPDDHTDQHTREHTDEQGDLVRSAADALLGVLL